MKRILKRKIFQDKLFLATRSLLSLSGCSMVHWRKIF